MGNWAARWDNVGFDGPIIPPAREYEVPDALVGSPAVNIGYQVADITAGPKNTFQLKGVDLAGVTRARIALSTWFDMGTYDQYVLKFRFNGGPWHDRMLTPDEIVARTAPVLVGQNPGGTQGAIGMMIDVPLSDLKTGDNTLEFVNSMVPQSWPMALANIDLIVSSN